MPNIFYALILSTCLAACNSPLASEPGVPAAHPSDQKIATYLPRFGRTRPVIAVIGENKGTELTDFVIPYGVLARSQVAEVVAVATHPGRIQMTPATVTIEAQASIDQFDERFPDGADYIIVPKVTHSDDPRLLGWIVAQSKKGGTIVSICDGALAVANTGLMNGVKATAHWATQALRAESYPKVKWVKNARYVADGKIVSSAGISAAMPTALALVEAIAGHDTALELATQLGVSTWAGSHDSDAFQLDFGSNRSTLEALNAGQSWFRRAQSIGVPVAPGVDEIALALSLDAYSRTGRSHAYALAATFAPVRTRNGLTIYPERLRGGADVDIALPALDDTPPAQVFDKVLDDIGQRYGASTAEGVALIFEYSRTRTDQSGKAR